MSDEQQSEVEKLRAGGEAAMAELFCQYRQQLEHMIGFRMDARLRGRIDPADVLQEAYLHIAARLDNYLESPEVSFYVWMRQQTYQSLVDQHRLHFRSKRTPGQEIQRPAASNNTTYSIVGRLVGDKTAPERAVEREEEREQLHQALETMEDIDQEVLALRHFEGLPNNQVAEILDISVTAASNRYVRAMTRLSEIMKKLGHE